MIIKMQSQIIKTQALLQTGNTKKQKLWLVKNISNRWI